MDEEERYVDEFGSPLPRFNPLEPDKRGRHKTFASAADAALSDLMTVKDPFFDSLADKWRDLFPNLPVKPGRFDDGKIVLYVKTAPLSFAMRPQLPRIRKVLLGLPGAPKRLSLRLEIHA